jgi:hypothetical protein
LGELRQVSRRKETGEEVEWVETRVKDLGPALDRKAFATLLKPYLPHVIRPDKRRHLRVIFTSLEDIVKAREALMKAVPETSFGAYPPAEETRRAQVLQAPSAEHAQNLHAPCAPPCANGARNPGGGDRDVKFSEGKESRKERRGYENTGDDDEIRSMTREEVLKVVEESLSRSGYMSATVSEEEKAKEELEKLIAEHRPEGPAASAEAELQSVQPARRGAVEKKSRDEVLREFKELVKKYGKV